MSEQIVRAALRQAFNLGSTYWQQVDSEYPSQWKKADLTTTKFNQLVEETCAAIAPKGKTAFDTLPDDYETGDY